VLDLDLAGKYIGPMHPEIVQDTPGVCSICGMALVSAESYGYAEQVEDDPNASLLIPATAVLLTGTRAVIYVEVEHSGGLTYEGRTIELGPRAGDSYVVRSGLKEGERVVTNGAFKLDAELQIHAKPSMMSPEGSNLTPMHDHSTGSKGPDQPANKDGMKMVSETETSTEPVKVDETLAVELRNTLQPVYAAYFNLQAAFASDDVAVAQVAATDLHADMASMESEGWSDLHSTIQTGAATKGNASSIEGARVAFKTLSDAFISLESEIGHAGDESWFRVRCPMAFGNEGADWLQTKDDVLNPYYGASMLHCGSVQETLEASHSGDEK
jgi:Cu(I)/Ag(I) efflux system membrane fusion protein